MLYRKNKTVKQSNLKKKLFILGLFITSLQSVMIHAEQASNELYTQHHAKAKHPILAEIVALSFDKPQDVQKVIEHILNDETLDPLEILEHLEETGNKTGNKNIKKLVSFVRALIIELTNAQIKTESEAKKIVLKIATKEGALKLIDPVQKALASLDKKNQGRKI